MPTLDDLKPKPFKVSLKGHEFECKPLRLSHTLTVSRLAELFNDSGKITMKSAKAAEKDLDELIADLIPELTGVQLDLNDSMHLLTQMVNSVEPEESKELSEANVQFDTEKKVERDG